MNVYISLLLVLSLLSAFGNGIIFDKLAGTAKKVRCGLHGIGSKIISHGHHHDPCEEQQGEVDVPYEDNVNSNDGKDKQDLNQGWSTNPTYLPTSPDISQNKASEEPSANLSELSTVSSSPKINEEYATNKFTTAKPVESTTGRRLLSNVKANCEGNLVADNSGNCREEY